ncbi:hypothetical protein BC832DRAFT_589373 [Gaertneriomyces semiglobifer]|nr:hypothetical protein BC832DRAFT_589373 [Gaertneriomyces semiglobifer]
MDSTQNREQQAAAATSSETWRSISGGSSNATGEMPCPCASTGSTSRTSSRRSASPSTASSSQSPRPRIKSPGEFGDWVKSWVALSRLGPDRHIHSHEYDRLRGEVAKRATVDQSWATIRRLRKRNTTAKRGARLTDLPPEVLYQIFSYLPPQTLSTLLATPSAYITQITSKSIARQSHIITSLASLHTFLGYGGNMPFFYRTSTMLLFAKHFWRLVPEAKELMGWGYAIVLAWFLIAFYTVPFLLTLIIYTILDLLSALARLHLSYTPHPVSKIVAQLFSPSKRDRRPPSYTHCVSTLKFSPRPSNSSIRRNANGTPSSPPPGARGLMNPYASHLYLLSSCCANLKHLWISRCSLAWWFRLDKLTHLESLILEACEVDETGLEVLAGCCGSSLRKLVVVGGRLRCSISQADLGPAAPGKEVEGITEEPEQQQQARRHVRARRYSTGVSIFSRLAHLTIINSPCTPAFDPATSAAPPPSPAINTKTLAYVLSIAPELVSLKLERSAICKGLKQVLVDRISCREPGRSSEHSDTIAATQMRYAVVIDSNGVTWRNAMQSQEKSVYKDIWAVRSVDGVTEIREGVTGRMKRKSEERERIDEATAPPDGDG